MKTINLRKYYPHYSNNCLVSVPDEVAALIEKEERNEAAQLRRTYRYRAHYSLDQRDGLENKTLHHVLLPQELYEHKFDMERLYTVLSRLPVGQARRISAYYLYGMSKAAIARAEGVSERTVRDSIRRGLENLRNLSEKNLR